MRNGAQSLRHLNTYFQVSGAVCICGGCGGVEVWCGYKDVWNVGVVL